MQCIELEFWQILIQASCEPTHGCATNFRKSATNKYNEWTAQALQREISHIVNTSAILAQGCKGDGVFRIYCARVPNENNAIRSIKVCDLVAAKEIQM